MLAKIRVADYMTKRLVKLHKNTDIFDAIKLLLEHKITSAPVVDEHGALIGIFSEKDGIKVVLDSVYNQTVSAKVTEFMAEDVVSVDAESSIVDLAERFKDSAIRAFPVFDDNELVGIVSRTDILKALVSIR